MINMKSKIFFLLLVLAMVVPFAAFSAPKYSWKLASELPETHPVNKALVFFADKVGEKTKGEVKITVYPSGQLGHEKDYEEGVKAGSIEITKVSASTLGQYSTSLQVCSLPFIFRDENHLHNVVDGPIGLRLANDLVKSGFKLLSWMDAGSRSLTTRDRPINKVEDLKGMKIRVMQSKPLVDTMKAFGCMPVPMDMTDVYVALQQEVVDGWENNEPTVYSYNMQEVCKYYSYSRHITVPDVLIISAKVYNFVPKNIQNALVAAAKEATVYQRKIWAELIVQDKKNLEKKGMIFNEIKDIMPFRKAAEPVYKNYYSVVGKDLIDAIIATK